LPLLHSLITLQGYDNQLRYLLIQLSCYTVIISSISLFNNLLLMYIITGIFIWFTFSASWRRRADNQQLKKHYAILPSVAILMISLLTLVVGNTLLLSLLIIPCFISWPLLISPASERRNYILGYAGGIDLSAYIEPQTSHTSRVEPVISTNHDDSILSLSSYPSSAQSSTNYVEPQSPTAQPLTQLFNRLVNLFSRSTKFTIAKHALVFIIGCMLTTIFFVSTTQLTNTESKPVENSASTITTRNPLVMPSGFTLLMTTHNGLVLKWPSKQTTAKAGQLWSQKNAEGQKNCQLIEFNGHQSIRTLSVSLDSNQYYNAIFSPLDTSALLQSIAFKRSFTLCGYTFSLTGSQAALGKNQHYAGYIRY